MDMTCFPLGSRLENERFGPFWTWDRRINLGFFKVVYTILYPTYPYIKGLIFSYASRKLHFFERLCHIFRHSQCPDTQVSTSCLGVNAPCLTPSAGQGMFIRTHEDRHGEKIMAAPKKTWRQWQPHVYASDKPSRPFKELPYMSILLSSSIPSSIPCHIYVMFKSSVHHKVFSPSPVDVPGSYTCCCSQH